MSEELTVLQDSPDELPMYKEAGQSADAKAGAGANPEDDAENAWMSPARLEKLLGQGYRLAGNHTAVKVCEWTKKALRGDGTCYKHRFYGIESWRCVQMSPVLDTCNLACEWCWRDISKRETKLSIEEDPVDTIFGNSVEAHKKLLVGFKGNRTAVEQRVSEMDVPMHFAISLTGEPTLFKHLPELIDEINAHGCSTFLVSNGTQPEMVRKLIKHQPTQIYVTMPAPDEETFKRACHPLEKDAWQRIMETLSLLRHFNRSVIRLTLTKGVNAKDAKKFAQIVKETAKPNFVELKSYVAVGFSRKRVGLKGMLEMEEVREFAREFNEELGFVYADEHLPSRVALLWDGKTPRWIDFKAWAKAHKTKGVKTEQHREFETRIDPSHEMNAKLMKAGRGFEQQ